MPALTENAPGPGGPPDGWSELVRLVREELRDLMKEVAALRVEVEGLRVRNEKVSVLETRVATLELQNQHMIGQREVTTRNINWFMGITSAVIGALVTAAIISSWHLK